MTKEPKAETKPDIDLRLATIRRDCLQLANDHEKSTSEVIQRATEMYNFITGIEQPKQEWK